MDAGEKTTLEIVGELTRMDTQPGQPGKVFLNPRA